MKISQRLTYMSKNFAGPQSSDNVFVNDDTCASRLNRFSNDFVSSRGRGYQFYLTSPHQLSLTPNERIIGTKYKISSCDDVLKSEKCPEFIAKFDILFVVQLAKRKDGNYGEIILMEKQILYH